MMNWKPGIFDILIAVLVAVVILLPHRQSIVKPAYTFEIPQLAVLAHAQANAYKQAPSGDSVLQIAELMLPEGQSDWVARIAGSVLDVDTADAPDPQDTPPPSGKIASRWKVALTLSLAFGDRLDIQTAHRYAQMAVENCVASPKECLPADSGRLAVYFQRLDAGLQSGIDPKLDPIRYRQAAEKGLRTIRTTP